ncbi:MAG: hypothetical protein MPI95_06940 [Nitrosopumilus sp.]|nr:hypothetical protein [Nitrosopumilus sp.]CAI9830939.1 conserved hypothetical protein [Nitrosopumilaceae archaeon]MDA7942213.1 hypothetical protein [Nitrosopumilus sp.]MDA7944110.1 hypothetical protein [Nitrosopumilus sp.]MDA7945647.1 hypothetical protein [Nitrosopumilus sp.]
MTCKGICIRYKAQKPVGTGRYASGQRRCQICEIFIKWEGLWCPCCGYRLRTKPRNLKYKAKLRARVEADSLEAKAARRKSARTRTKKPCKYCKRLFVYPDRHGKICKKNPAVAAPANEAIAIKT